MRNMKTFGRRGLALLLAMIMCLSMAQLTVFAADEGIDTGVNASDAVTSDDGSSSSEIQGGDDAETSYKSAEDAGVTIPDSAEVVPGHREESNSTGGTTITDSTQTSWGYTDEENSSNTSNSSTTGSGTAGDGTDVGEDEAIGNVNDLTGEHAGDVLDTIKDGTYTKTETETETNVTVTIKGQQDKSDSNIYDAAGNLIGASGSVSGSQNTTTDTSVTGTSTTTTVNKQTEGETVGETSVENQIQNNERELDVTTSNQQTGDATEEDLDGIQVTLGSDLFNQGAITSDELTVSKGDPNASSGSQASTSVNEANLTRDLLTALDGWTVAAGNTSATVKVDGAGNVSFVDENGDPVQGFEVELVSDGKGGYSIQASKTTTTIRTGEETTVQENTNYTKTESGFEWGDEVYEITGEVVNEDGSTTVTYVKTGEANRTDTRAYYKVTTRTDGVKIVTQTATVGATLTNGSYTVQAAWGDIADRNVNNDDIVITMLGPSKTVIQLAVTNRMDTNKAPDQHIISAGYSNLALFLGKTEDEVKKMSAQQIADALAKTNAGMESEGIKLDGSFIQSSVFIKDANGGGVGAWLRRMSDGKGGYFYVYCAQHGKGTTAGTGYDIVNIDEPGYLYAGNANHIQYVVEKGWWGADSGAGSLTEVRKLVTENDADQIDAGIALAVTQAAIWYYSAGKDANDSIDPDVDIFTKAWTYGSGNSDKGKDNMYTALSEKQRAAAMELFNALIQKDKTDAEMANLVNKTTDFIHADDITSTSVQVVEKVDVTTREELDKLVSESLKDTNKSADTTDLAGKDVYKANVSVTLAVVPSKLNSDDLMVYVYSGETLVGSQRVTKVGLQQSNGKVTIENVVLENGANVRFHLDGTQNLTEGAYLFRSDVDCSTSQTMVGYVKGSTESNKVDLDVNMSFNVVTTQGSAVGGASVSGTTETYDETHKTAYYERYSVDVTETHEKTVLVTTTVTTTPIDEHRSQEERVVWADSYARSYTPDNGDDDADTDRRENDDDEDDDDFDIPDEPTPLAPGPEEELEILDEDVPLAAVPAEEEEELEILDEEVPLADVPMTGDLSAGWYAALALSAAGLLCLAVLDRKKRQEKP